MYFEVRLHFGNGTGERIPGAGLRHMVCADQALLCRCVVGFILRLYFQCPIYNMVSANGKPNRMELLDITAPLVNRTFGRNWVSVLG